MKVDYGEYFPIAEYYEKIVIPLDSRFKRSKKGMFVCCFHDDTDPSLGIIHSKDKGEIFHCFGCNAWGNIIDLHKKVSLKYYKKHIDDERAILELCGIFGVDVSELPNNKNENNGDRYIRRQLAMREAMGRFDVPYFHRKLVEGKMDGKDVPYFNTLLVKMIDEYKSSR